MEEKFEEKSGEMLKCGECMLEQEAYATCMKMNKSSKMTNFAIIMKINSKKMTIEIDQVRVHPGARAGHVHHARDRGGGQVLEDVEPEDIADELSRMPAYIYYNYKYVRQDGRATYPLCFIWYQPTGCPIEVNVLYGSSSPALIEKVSPHQRPSALTGVWLMVDWMGLADAAGFSSDQSNTYL
jgi:hypothetical protein